MKNINVVRRINRELIVNGDKFKDFKSQLLEYKYSKYPYNLPLVISPSSDILGVSELQDKPIVISQTVIRKIETTHEEAINSLMHLEEKLKGNVLVFESITQEQGLVIVLSDKDESGNHIICALHRNRMSGMSEVHGLRSIYGRSNLISLMERTFEKRKKFYPNARTESWLKSIRVQFPKDLDNSLFCNKGTIKHRKSKEKIR